MKVINSFRGDYGFLSNFHICKIEYNGRKFMHSEGLFQSMKTDDEFYLDDNPYEDYLDEYEDLY